MEASDVQRQLKFRREGAFTHGAMPARVSVHDAHVLCQIAAAREILVAPCARCDGDGPIRRTPVSAVLHIAK